jgi:type IV secretory pathway TrbL component
VPGSSGIAFITTSAVGSTSLTFSRGTTWSISGTAGAAARVMQITSMSNALALRAMSWPMRPMPRITMRAPSGAIM